MRNSSKSGKKAIEEVEALRSRKGKLERLRPDITKHKRAKEVPVGAAKSRPKATLAKEASLLSYCR